MKNLYFIFLLIACFIISCNRNNSSSTDETSNEVDSLQIVIKELHTDLEVKEFLKFFVKYELDNPRWFSSTEGQKKLINAFNEKMLNDSNFAKLASSYVQHRKGSILNMVPRVLPKVISNYDSLDGNYGQIICFAFNIDVPIIEPLHNGEYEIPVNYQIICPIPAKVENKDMPYIDNMNYINKTTKYKELNYGDGLYLGTYIIGEQNK